MNTFSYKLTVLAAALAINGLILSAVDYVFMLQEHLN
jgi:hypothetical protein